MMAVACVFFVIAAVHSKEKSIVMGSVAESGIGLGSALVGRFFQVYIDWPFCGSLFLFLALNLVLFQNRRNAKGDMLALEYQTLRRYIELKSRERKNDHK